MIRGGWTCPVCGQYLAHDTQRARVRHDQSAKHRAAVSRQTPKTSPTLRFPAWVTVEAATGRPVLEREQTTVLRQAVAVAQRGGATPLGIATLAVLAILSTVVGRDWLEDLKGAGGRV